MNRYRKTVIFSVITLIILIISGQTLLSSETFQPQFDGHEKMGLSLKGRWQRAMHDGDLDREVSCMVRLKERGDKKTIRDLKDAGLKVKTVLKTIITGRISIGDIPLLVSLDEVKTVSAGRKLSLK